MRWIGAVWLACGAACGAPAPDLAAVLPPPPPAPAERAEQLADAQHLLTDIPSRQAERGRAAARVAWTQAWEIAGPAWIAPLRQHDPDAALQIEYQFGRVLHAIEHERRADEPIRALDGAMEQARRALLAEAAAN